MSENQNEIIADLSQKINTVISLYEKVKKEKTDLEGKNTELNSQCKSLKLRLDNIETKYSNLKVAKQLSGNIEDTGDVKNKINKLVREIDKCMALLNK
jgi:predicted nuclease with TOPRIM domain